MEMTEFRTMKKAGPLRNGYERGKGSILHAVAVQGHGDARPALCGAQPAIQWSDCEGHEVTCPRCKRMLSIGRIEFASAGATRKV